ncbi:MAG: O-antigen ligase family protein [Caldilineales bacterium]
MTRSAHPSALDRIPAWLLALLALALGGLLALAFMAAASGQVGLADSRLTDIILPLTAAGCLIVLSLYSPLAGFLAWIALAPYSQHIALDLQLGSGIPDLSLSRMLAGFLLLLVITQAALGKRTLRPLAWSDLAYALFLFGLVLSVPQTVYGKLEGLQTILDAYIVPFIALFIARQVVRNQRDLRWLTAVLLASAVAFSLLIIREQLTGEVLLYSREAARYSRSFQKVVSLMGNAAPIGVSTAMAIPLGLTLLMQSLQADGPATTSRRVGQIALATALAICALGVYMTYNRASWLGVAVSLLVLLALRPRMRRMLLPLLLLASALALVFWQTVVNSPAVTERLLEDDSVGYRTTVLRLALEMSADHPIFGRGYNNFGAIARRSYGWNPNPLFGIDPPAHNSYTFLLVSGGLVALLPYLAWMALLAWQGVQRYRASASAWTRDALAAGAAVALTYFLASGTFDNLNHLAMNLIFYAIIGGIWGATERIPPGATARATLPPTRTFSGATDTTVGEVEEEEE